MKTKKTQMAKGLITTLFLLVASTAMQAQEYTPAEQSGKTTEETEEAINLQGDTGIEVVQEVQAGKLDDVKPERKPADQLVRELLFDEWEETQGWNNEKKRMFQIGVVKFTMKDPASDKNFLAKRELMIKRATLMAKGEIIRSIMTEISGADQLDIPETDPAKKLGKAHAEALEAMAKQQRVVQSLCAEAGILKNEYAKGVTTKDRINAFMDWALGALDKTYNSKEITAAKKKKYDAAKNAYLASLKKLELLEKEANKMAENLRGKQMSTGELYSRMPLLGASTVWQSESWFKTPPRQGDQPNQFTVAVLLVWSKGLEAAARSTIDGTKVTTSKPVKQDKGFRNYVLKDLELNALNGPHIYMDENGKRWFMGIAARPDTNVGRRAAKVSAYQMAIFSMMSDLEFYEKLNQQGNIYGLEDDMESLEVAESVTTKLSQSLTNHKVSGIKEIVQRTVIHPTTGKRMFVSVQYIDPVLAARAPDLFKESHKSALAAIKRSQYLSGFIAGVESSRNDAERDGGAHSAGRADGRIDPKTGKPVKGGTGSTEGSNSPKKPAPPRESKEGDNSPKKPKKPPF